MKLHRSYAAEQRMVLLRDELKRVLPKRSIGQAVGYLRNQWEVPQCYLNDGHLPLDNPY